MIPRATYRLQFHKNFTFSDAAAQVDYFAALGISHIYASPILTARAGSLHGYDVVDHAHVNPELGGEADFRTLVAALKSRGLGMIVDIVPNHMAVGKADNIWWLDLLSNGPMSRYAHTFDIDWDAPGLENKIFLPFLDGAPEHLFSNGDLKLVQDDGLSWSFAYFDHRFPLRPEDQRDPHRVSPRDLLAHQHFVLADWREADARINWRRFFDITDLAAIRVAEPAVFEAVHKKIFALYFEGLVDGVRIDHVDGIADPRGYCRLLRQRLAASGREPYLVVEKILAENERMALDWQVDGTTGYDFMDEISALLHSEDGGALERLWQYYGKRARDFEAEEEEARRKIVTDRFKSQLAATARAFARLLPISVTRLSTGLVEIIVHLRCYRSYTNGTVDSPGLESHLASAFSRAAIAIPDDASVVAAIATVFSRRDDENLVIDALRRFHQLSAPVAAKAVEDTALYRYGRLLSRNDVGFDPRTHRFDIAAFHERMERRARDWPGTMLATATHDHKRGEDARARLAVLSVEHVAWADLAATVLVQAPKLLDLGDVYQLLQSVIGAWPESRQDDFCERIANWGRKYLREAKLHSNWDKPATHYERIFCEFACALAGVDETAALHQAIAAFVQRIEPQAKANALLQTVLRCTLPGVPDLYQGCEFSDYSLVDPDNRRPVDFAARAETLGEGTQFKQAYIQVLCALRAADPNFWHTADYHPLAVQGGPHILAFARRQKARQIIVIARCHSSGVAEGRLEQPLEDSHDVMTGKVVAGDNVARLLGEAPVCILSSA